jgi:hypothetical protein
VESSLQWKTLQNVSIGNSLRGKVIKDVIQLSSGWYLVKTEDGKSKNDFRVRVVTQTNPRMRTFTPKHAHFLIDFYGKLCSSHESGKMVLNAIIDVWNGEPVTGVLESHDRKSDSFPGYPLEYILHAMNWILDQEDVNFTKRSAEKQKFIDLSLKNAGVTRIPLRPGSQLAIALFCDVFSGIHPVEALIRANLDVIPIKKARGTQ